MKRNKQQKLRMKLIQEFHLKKEQQKKLDNCVNEGILTYKEIYEYKHRPILLKYYYNIKKSGEYAMYIRNLFLTNANEALKNISNHIINNISFSRGGEWK